MIDCYLAQGLGRVALVVALVVAQGSAENLQEAATRNLAATFRF